MFRQSGITTSHSVFKVPIQFRARFVNKPLLHSLYKQNTFKWDADSRILTFYFKAQQQATAFQRTLTTTLLDDLEDKVRIRQSSLSLEYPPELQPELYGESQSSEDETTPSFTITDSNYHDDWDMSSIRVEVDAIDSGCFMPTPQPWQQGLVPVPLPGKADEYFVPAYLPRWYPEGHKQDDILRKAVELAYNHLYPHQHKQEKFMLATTMRKLNNGPCRFCCPNGRRPYSGPSHATWACKGFAKVSFSGLLESGHGINTHQYVHYGLMTLPYFHVGPIAEFWETCIFCRPLTDYEVYTFIQAAITPPVDICSQCGGRYHQKQDVTNGQLFCQFTPIYRALPEKRKKEFHLFFNYMTALVNFIGADNFYSILATVSRPKRFSTTPLNPCAKVQAANDAMNDLSKDQDDVHT